METFLKEQFKLDDRCIDIILYCNLPRSHSIGIHFVLLIREQHSSTRTERFSLYMLKPPSRDCSSISPVKEYTVTPPSSTLFMVAIASLRYAFVTRE